MQEHRDETVVKSRGIHECGENPCSSIPCLNGGQCLEVDNDLYRCECENQYSGDFCENHIDPCFPNPCNGGFCEVKAGKTKCRCPSEKKGERCELGRFYK